MEVMISSFMVIFMMLMYFFFNWRIQMKSFLMLGMSFFMNFPMFSGSSIASFSPMLILLTWSIFFSILLNESAEASFMKKNHLYWVNLMALFFVLQLFFSTSSLLILYLMFETSLIPMTILIMGWGYQPERLAAALSMILYMLVSSLPLFFMILMVYNFFIFSLEQMKESTQMSLSVSTLQMLILLFSMLSFLVKFPMFMIHLWLPKAHVEAPLSGSMILAGILLKMGGYGAVVLSPFFLSSSFNYILISLSLMGGVWATYVCLQQVDLKMLIAYFSVVHMSVCISCIFSMSHMSHLGMSLILISHGLCSTGMFMFVYIIYCHTNSRNTLLSGGMLNYYPSFTKMIMLLILGNMGTPPTLNFFGEIFSYSSLISLNWILFFPALIVLLFGVIVTILLFASTQYGVWHSKSLNYFQSMSSSNFSLSCLLFFMFFSIFIMSVI